MKYTMASSTHRWTLIVPCAAPLQKNSLSRPKWLLTTPQGDLLVSRAAATVPPESVGRTIVTLTRDCEDRYKVSEALRRAFSNGAECVVLDAQTEGPAHTVRETIARANVTGPICIKDGDSFFALDDMPDASFIAVTDVRGLTALSAPGRKSYVRLNEQGMIVQIAERSMISNLISVGLYGFDDVSNYVAAYDRLKEMTGHQKAFVSHVAGAALLDGSLFKPCVARDIVDIGTTSDWSSFRAAYPTIVLDIDGVIFANQSKFFSPFWGEPPAAIPDNVAHLVALQRRGAQLVFMTARPEEYREVTIAALSELGLRVHGLIMGCSHSARFLVNDYAQSNPYPSAVAVNVRRNMAELQHLLLADNILRDQDL